MRWLIAVALLISLLLALPARGAVHWPDGAEFLDNLIPQGLGKCVDPDTGQWKTCQVFMDPRSGIRYYAIANEEGLVKVWRRLKNGETEVVWRVSCREPCA